MLQIGKFLNYLQVKNFFGSFIIFLENFEAVKKVIKSITGQREMQKFMRFHEVFSKKPHEIS
jgi:hypothetical protein